MEFTQEIKQNNPETPDKITVYTLQGFHNLQLKDIIRLQSDSNYTMLYLLDGTKITVAKTLKDYDAMLCDKGFLRVHRSHLVNVTHIKSYIKEERGSILMSDNTKIEVSRRKKSKFLAKYPVKEA
jgi:two-component system LytT family response regulator